MSELSLELLECHLASGGAAGKKLIILEVLIGKPPHVDAGDLEGLAVAVDKPGPDTAGLRVEEILEWAWLDLAVALDDEGSGPAVDEGINSAITKLPSVDSIVGDWVSATELVTDLLRGDTDAKAADTLAKLVSESAGKLSIIKKDVAVWVLWWLAVTEELAQSLVGHAADKTLSKNADTIWLAIGEALEHGSLDKFDNILELDFSTLELFWDKAKVGTRSLGNTKGKVASGTAHSLDKEPTWGALGVDHQVADNLHTEAAGGVETEGALAGWKWKIVIDGLRAGDHGDFLAVHALGNGDSGGRGIVTTDGKEVTDLEGAEDLPDVVEGLFIATRVGTRGLDDGTTLEVDAGDDIVGEVHGVGLDLLDITGHEVLESLHEADDLPPKAEGVKSGAGNDTVEAWGWATTAKDTENWSFLAAHWKSEERGSDQACLKRWHRLKKLNDTIIELCTWP